MLGLSVVRQADVKETRVLSRRKRMQVVNAGAYKHHVFGSYCHLSRSLSSDYLLFRKELLVFVGANVIIGKFRV